MSAPRDNAVRPLRMGMIGLGQGAAGVVPTMDDLPEIELVAGTDTNAAMRAAFAARYPAAKCYESVAELCADANVEAVWIATPNRLHCEHTLQAIAAGKHVIIEKPMAVTLDEADRMVEGARRAGVKLLAGHTSSFSIPVRAMRRLVVSGEVGRPRAILLWSYTDWMLRPRTEEELAPSAGGGIVHRQAPHQLDTLRLLGGGVLRSVRGTYGSWMPERPAPGFYTAYLEFENGLTATMLHNGYGYFVTLELYDGALDRWRYSNEDRVAMRRALRGGKRNEDVEKQEFRIGGRRDPALEQPTELQPWSPLDLGMLVLSCDGADIRHSPYGLYVYGDDGRREIDLRHLVRGEVDLEAGATVPALLEMHAAVVFGKPVYHSGEWGRATLEATIGIIRSADEHREIKLERQVAMPTDYDSDLALYAGTTA